MSRGGVKEDVIFGTEDEVQIFPNPMPSHQRSMIVKTLPDSSHVMRD